MLFESQNSASSRTYPTLAESHEHSGAVERWPTPPFPTAEVRLSDCEKRCTAVAADIIVTQPGTERSYSLITLTELTKEGLAQVKSPLRSDMTSPES